MKGKRDDIVGSGEHAMNRGELLALSLAAGGGIMLGGAGGALASTRAATNTPGQGPKKKMIGALGYGTCPCVQVIQVGFKNAAELVGWEYQGILAPEVDQNAENLNRTYQQAITAQPAAIGGGMWFPTAAQQAKRAIAKGIYFISVNTPDNAFIKANRISFVGQDLYQGGVLAGTLICEQLVKNGKKTGLILTGNVSPGSVPIEERFRGIKDGTTAFNKAHGTKFTNQQFPDQSADLAQSLPIYKAKITQVGSKLVALANTSTQTSIANFKIAQELKWKPGQIVMGGFDTDPVINQAIQQGYHLFTLDQQFFSQGFFGLMLTWQKLTRGFNPPPVFDTGNSVVNKSNIKAIDARDNAIRALAKRYGLKV
jgi:ABC-type sugar transport system substrate-binding protein